MPTGSKTGIPMARSTRLSILTRAREIINDRQRWGRERLRRLDGDQPQYCVLGACERAAYDLGLLPEPSNAFTAADDNSGAYAISLDLYFTTRCGNTRKSHDLQHLQS